MYGGRRTDEDRGATVDELEENMGVDTVGGSCRGSSWQSQIEEQSRTVASLLDVAEGAAESVQRLRSMLPLQPLLRHDRRSSIYSTAF